MAAMMKAVRIHQYGGPDVLMYEDAPRPSAGPGEVVVRILATSVNPFDCALRAGYLVNYLQLPMPFIVGTDIAGVVSAIGEGVTAFKPGDEVYARGGVMRDGANAEFASVPAWDVAARPRSVDVFHAAALPHVSLTAWQALRELGELAEGQTVLIHGAGGGVGHIAVQLAKWLGAKVIGTASHDLEALKQLGVDQVIDYTKSPFEAEVRDADLVLDTVGGETQERSWAVLKPGGILVSAVQPPSPETAAARGVRQAFVASTPPIGATLTEVARLVDEGSLKPAVATVLPLRDVRKAHALVEGRHVHGKVVLQVE